MLRLDDLQVSLDAEAGIVRAVDGLALSIDRGETFALVGESGCGKSTSCRQPGGCFPRLNTHAFSTWWARCIWAAGP